MDKSIIASLSLKLDELLAYARTQTWQVEPNRYPKGLFQASKQTETAYQLDAYLDEIQSDIQSLASRENQHLSIRQAELVLQKITVLVRSIHSQHLRKQSLSPLESLKRTLSRDRVDILDYLVNKD